MRSLSSAPPRMILLNAYSDPKAANWLSDRVHATVPLVQEKIEKFSQYPEFVRFLFEPVAPPAGVDPRRRLPAEPAFFSTVAVSQVGYAPGMRKEFTAPGQASRFAVEDVRAGREFVVIRQAGHSAAPALTLSPPIVYGDLVIVGNGVGDDKPAPAPQRSIASRIPSRPCTMVAK